MKALTIFSFFLMATTSFGQVINKTNQNYVTVFESKFGAKTHQYYRIPSLVTLNKSDDNQSILFAFAEQRIGNGNSDSGNINVVYKMSFNNGRDWGRQYLACTYRKNNREGTCGNPTVTIDQKSGYIHLFMNGNEGHKKQFHASSEEERFRPGDRKIFYMRGKYSPGIKKIKWDTDSKGRNRRDLTSALQSKYNEAFDVVGPGVGIVYDNPKSTRNGRVIIPAARRNFYSDNANTASFSNIEWIESELFGANLSSETAIVQLPNKSLYRNDRMHGRYNQGPYCTDPGCKTRRMVSLVSNVGTELKNPKVDKRLIKPPKTDPCIIRLFGGIYGKTRKKV